jgi:hypothetical protein
MAFTTSPTPYPPSPDAGTPATGYGAPSPYGVPESPYGAPGFTPYGAPPPVPPARERSTRGAHRVLVILGAVFAGLVVVALLGLGFGWRAFVRFGVADDLKQYQDLVQRAELDPPTKLELNAEIRRLRDQVRDGELKPAFWEWLEIDGTVRGALKEAPVTPIGLDNVRHELGRLARRR